MRIELEKLFRLSLEDAAEAGEMMARVLFDEPVMSHYLPDIAERELALPCYYTLLARYSILHGEVYAPSPELEAVAGWLPPGKTSVTRARLLGARESGLRSTAGADAAERTFSRHDFAAEVQQRHAPYPHWYLLMLGVDSCCRDEGYEHMLLRAGLERVDRERLACYLETYDEHDVVVYQRYGFNVVEATVLPDVGVKLWAMLRRPGGKPEPKTAKASAEAGGEILQEAQQQ